MCQCPSPHSNLQHYRNSRIGHASDQIKTWCVCRLSTLERLDLRNNELASLPPELGLMTQLKAMPVTGNPVRGVKPSLLDGPLKPLLAALRHRLPQPASRIPALGTASFPSFWHPGHSQESLPEVWLL